MPLEVISSEEVSRRLNDALDRFFEHDFDLLRVSSSERSVCGALAAHLHSAFSGYDVDVEYNRIGEDKIKTMGLRQPDGSDKMSPVYPDIIVHKRTVEEGSNLLVLEVKKHQSDGSASYQEDKSYDLYKLDKYKEELRYQDAIFVEFPTGVSAQRSKVVLVPR